MSGASLPTRSGKGKRTCKNVLIPDEWGKSSDKATGKVPTLKEVLIPDEWGKSSDATKERATSGYYAS